MTVGIDSVEISRIAELINKRGSFLTRFFSEAERAEFESRSFHAEHVAAAFAAKEAFSKAVGTGISGFDLKDVSLLHYKSGKPYLSFEKSAAEIVGESGANFDVSITHTDSVATAVVISF